MIALGGGWDEALAPLFQDENYKKIREFLKREYTHHVVYPDMYDIYNCFKLTPLAQVKAVILGQDPYHNEGQAHGLCFSVQEGVPMPPSLVNIFKELHDELGCTLPRSGDLSKWAKEGVLLLNTALTVRAHHANSHKDCGWTWFTDNVIRIVSERREHVVFILWGANARSKKPLIDASRHLVLECAHPSPLSAYNGFFGCGHFKKANAYLTAHGEAPIDWQL